ncbi:xanthine phosphoribosyltransferase [Peribacillus sp. NPDC096447]|uniref:xanthine phosphoribosyltransferase n=1 Tax=Peribacillus sp. NPDC096447 TaxID=3364394 RepID=UPI003818F227
MEEINQDKIANVIEDTQQTDDVVEDVHTDVSEDNQEVVEEKTYTQADIDALQAQVDELSQYKPKELTEDETKIQQKLESIWDREVNQTLKEEGLEIFAEFIKADVDDTETLKKQITKLKEIVGSLELSNGYQPSNHKTVDGYSIAKKNKDVNGMIREKLKF